MFRIRHFNINLPENVDCNDSLYRAASYATPAAIENVIKKTFVSDESIKVIKRQSSVLKSNKSSLIRVSSLFMTSQQFIDNIEEEKIENIVEIKSSSKIIAEKMIDYSFTKAISSSEEAVAEAEEYYELKQNIVNSFFIAWKKYLKCKNMYINKVYRRYFKLLKKSVINSKCKRSISRILIIRYNCVIRYFIS